MVDREAFNEWLEENQKQVEFIFHLGARTNTAEFDVAIFNKLNLEYSQMVWSACVKFGLPLVYASSAATYGMGEFGYIDDHAIKTTRELNIPTESVISVEFTHSFAVLKTHSGFASGVATFIDSVKMPEIIGTLAGDDTILLITREPYTQNQILASLRKYFPELEQR